MRKLTGVITVLSLILFVFLNLSPAFAEDMKKDAEKKVAEINPVVDASMDPEMEDLKMADDIRKEHIFGRSENIVGPGSVFVNTGLKDGENIMMSFGATIRMIPTIESDYDFGLGDTVPGFLQGYSGMGISPLSAGYFKQHLNEAGAINNSYIRNEDKLYFNAMPRDKKWSFYAALEFDGALEQGSVDARGGKTSTSSNFGLERLHGTIALPGDVRFHAGWDVWHIDGFDGGGLLYGDDNPGFWLTGNYNAFSYNVGYFKLNEDDWQGFSGGTLDDDTDDDRDLYAAQVDWYSADKKHKIKGFYALDLIKNAVSKDIIGLINSGVEADTTSHHVGSFYVGKFGGLELFAEGVYQFGEAEDTGLATDDFDISAFALAADISYQFKGVLTGFPLKPHLGIMYTSGDDDPTDDELNGYNGVENAQRYSARWGGENTIIGDTNYILGSMLYGYLPEMYGNGTPVQTGGVMTNRGAGRGDNPGMTMISLGLTMAPKKFLIYKTNINAFIWNEDFNVPSFVQLGLYTPIESGYAGTEWDNEITLALSRHMFIKTQFSFFFPGDGVEDVTKALSATAAGLGEGADDVATRLAFEFIWNF